MKTFSRRIGIAVILVTIVAAWQLTTPAQQGEQKSTIGVAKVGTRFQFEVIESFDAKYLGDTPGHIGRAGGIEGVRPRISLGDPVYRDETKVGMVSTVTWSRVQGSLTIEFDPEPLTRICVGDQVWVDLNPSAPDAATR